MPPQPLSTVFPNTGVVFIGAGRTALHLRPDLAPYVGEVIGAWAMVEAAQLRLFVDLLGGPQELAASIFISLDASGPKSAAINAAASKRLEGDELKLFRILNEIFNTRRKSRDKIAHWVWGIAPKLLDGVLLADPRDSFKPLKPGDDPARFDRIFVYREKEFIEILKAYGQLSGFLVRFREMFGFQGEQRSKRFLELWQEPEVRETLARRASRDQSNGG